MEKQYTFEEAIQVIPQILQKQIELENKLNRLISQEPQQKDQLLTVPEAADFLNLAVPTIYGMISRKELPVIKKTKRCYFLKDDLILYLKSGRKKTSAEIETEAQQYIENRKK